MGHGAMTGRMLERIEEILIKENPDWVLVYGDTNSTLAGALAAKKLHINVVHVEAGLRSFNMRMPEEINRILTDRISDILCCPTETAVLNLVNEGFKRFSDVQARDKNPLVINTGDVMQDAALYYSAFSAEKSNIVEELGLQGKEFILCTIHRAENTDDVERLRSIVAALNEMSLDRPIILPLHPRTNKIIELNKLALNFTPIRPVGYFDMLELLKKTRLVLTDSGGLQKEAYFFKKPCLTLRDETEWVELVENGFNELVGTQMADILRAYHQVLLSGSDFAIDLYGNGSASSRIVGLLQ